jgi:3-deoxy-D-manno-octulosonate 8-phosphate phosphatase (KDO 8-P phosphatase)
MDKEILDRAKKVRLLGIDVDGVMTDGSIMYSESEELKNFYVRDGAGIYFANRVGLIIAIITVRESKILVKRAAELEVTELHMGIKRKWDCMESLLEKYNLKKEEIGFIGDDLVDIPVLKRVGFPVAVGDAVDETKEESIYVTQTKGGRGAVREVIEIILKAKGTWEKALKEYYEEID